MSLEGFPEFPQHRLPSQSLAIGDLVYVVEFLEKRGFSQKKWNGLGLRLGLHKNTLEVIEENHRGDVSRCLTECLTEWLRRADSVNLRGGATWDSLSDAVRALNEIAVADMLDSEKCPHRHVMAISIFDSHCPNLLRDLIDPLDIACMLQKEGIITEEVLANLEKSADDKKCQVLLDDLRKVMSFSSLEKFVRVLCIKRNVTLANAIYHDYEEKILKGNSQIQWKTDPEVVTPTRCMPSNTKIFIPLPRNMKPKFSSLRSSFNRMFSNVLKVTKKIDDLSIEEIKLYLKDNYARCLQDDLDEVDTMHDVLYLLKKECSLIDLNILEEIVEEFQILGAQIYIDSYKTLMKELCKSIKHCCNESFAAVRTSPFLQCQTAVFLLDWKPEEHTIEDIKDLLSEATGKFVKIEFIEETNSITVTCSFSYCLIESVKKELKNKLSILIEKGLMKLIVGYEIIYQKPKTLKVDTEEVKLQSEEVDEMENLINGKSSVKGIRFAIIIDNCGEVKIEEDDTRTLNKQAESLYKALDGSGFCVLYLNNLSSAAINSLLRAFMNDVNHSQLSMFALIFLSKGKTPQLYDANNEIIPFEDMFLYFCDGQSPLSRIPKIFFFDIACLDDKNQSQPTLPNYPKDSLALAVAHNDPNFSFAVETLSQSLNQQSIQDIFRMIQEMKGLKSNERNDNIDGEVIIDKSKNGCLGDHLLLLRSLWYPIRSKTVDVILKNKDEVMDIVMKERIARIATSTAGLVIGGGLVITGIALAPFTFGVSIGMTVAAGAVGVLASAGGIGAFILSRVLANKQLKYAQEHIALDQQLSLTINAVAEMYEKEVRATSFSQIARVAAAGGVMSIAAVSRFSAGVAIAAEGAFEGAALALRTGGRVAGMVLAGVSLAVTAPIDIGFIAYHSYHIHKANKDKTGKTDSNKAIQWLISQAEEMLKGMCVKIHSKEHEIAGGQCAVCDGIECGYKISVPLTPVKSSTVTVHTLFSGPITIPEGYTLVSAMYDITLPELQEPATITLDHCVEVNDVSIAKNLHFATATVDTNDRVLPFSPVSNEGVFLPGETSGSIKFKESCFLCILYKGPLELIKYTAHVQQLQENFDITFLKNLKPHLKFSQQRPSIDSDYFYQFRFATVADGDEQAVKLSNCRDIIETKGWTVTPIGEIPQTIERKEIDTLELQPEVWKLQNEIFPTIRFHTGYNDEMDPPEEHPLLIDGIVPDKPILLKRPRRMH